MLNVYVAGIDNSGPDHWQRRWYDRDPTGIWVEHDSWTNPVCDEWVADLDATLRAADSPTFLIAHSLGATVVAEWAAGHADPPVSGAFLVAPPDVDGPHFPSAAIGFTLAEFRRLPFPTLVVASEDDPYGSPTHARSFAARAGARLVTVGRKGHLNAGSALGDWAEGHSLLHHHLAHLADSAS